jgi:ADP-heptose:LPS heptosyltransferase
MYFSGLENMKNIRIIREAGGLGDAVRVLAPCLSLRKKYPNARIHFYGSDYLKNLFLLERIPYIDCFFPCPNQIRPRDCYNFSYSHLKEKEKIFKYDATYDMWCPAYIHEPGTKGLVCQDRIELFCLNANVSPIRPFIKLIKKDLDVKDFYKKKYKNKKIIGIQVGATCPSREYPPYLWKELIFLLQSTGLFHIIVFDVCTRHLKDLEIAKYNGKIETSINDTWANTLGRLASCDLIITPDSGFFHLAGCLKLKTLGLFGCTSGLVTSRIWNYEEETHYYEQLKHGEINFRLLPKSCQPICYMQWCRGWKADRYRSEKKDYCSLLKQISPKRVLKRILDLL